MRSGQLRCRETYAKLTDFWMPYVDSTVTYPVDCVFTADELDIIDQYRTDFENTVSENEELQQVYQDAYDRYAENEE